MTMDLPGPVAGMIHGGGAELPRQQAIALMHLAAGQNVESAAQGAGVSRGTVYRWLQRDEAFARGLRDARHAGCAAARQQIVAVAPAALELVRGTVQDGDVSVSMAVVRAMKLLSRLETAEAGAA